MSKTIFIVRPNWQRAEMALEGWLKLHDTKEFVARPKKIRKGQIELEDGTRIIALTDSMVQQGATRGYSDVEYA